MNWKQLCLSRSLQDPAGAAPGHREPQGLDRGKTLLARTTPLVLYAALRASAALPGLSDGKLQLSPELRSGTAGVSPQLLHPQLQFPGRNSCNAELCAQSSGCPGPPRLRAQPGGPQPRTGLAPRCRAHPSGPGSPGPPAPAQLAAGAATAAPRPG